MTLEAIQTELKQLEPLIQAEWQRLSDLSRQQVQAVMAVEAKYDQLVSESRKSWCELRDRHNELKSALKVWQS